MQYCHGFTIEMAPGTGAQAYPDAAPSLLGPTYIARHGSHRAVVGATKTYGLSPADAAAAAGDGLGWHPTAVRPSLARAAVGDGGVESRVGSNEAGEEQGGARVPGVGDGKVGGAGGGAVAVVDEAEGTRVLEAAGRALWAPLEGWETVLVRGGVRGLPPRSPRGAVPLAGRVRGDEEGGQEVRGQGVREGGAASSMGGGGLTWTVVRGLQVWVLAGLGSRGLVYHGLLGEMVARAVLEGSPDEIGPEFRAWQGGQIVS